MAAPAPSVSPQQHQETADKHVDPPSTSRRAAPYVAAAAVIALIVGGVAIANRSDSEAGTLGAPTDDTVVGDASSTTTPALERTTTSPPTTTRPPTTPRTTPLPTVPPAPPEWIDGQIVVPDQLADIAGSTELVALTVGGKVIRINLPDGTTSTIDLDRRQPGGTLHLGATNMLISDNNGNTRGPTLLSVDNAPISIDIGGLGGVDVFGAGPGPDEFTAFVWSQNSGSERSIIIRADGQVDDADINDVNPWSQGHFTSTGERWISDAGGVYLEDTNGVTRRVSTGQLLAASGARLLTRECDEQRTCGWVVVDIESDERTPAQAPDGFTVWNQPIQFTELSPDGQSLLVAFWDDEDATLIDLTTGERTPATIASNNSNGNPTAHWAPDSSGYFTVKTGELLFVDRATGVTTTFDIDFGNTDAFSSIDVRSTSD